MPTTIQIKVDNAKMRLYFAGDVSLISKHLNTKGYAAITKTMAAAEDKINQVRAELSELNKLSFFQRSIVNALALVSVQAGPLVQKHMEMQEKSIARQQYLNSLANKTITGYRAPVYNLVWDESTSFVTLEYWFPVKQHFNDQHLMGALARLIQPLELPETNVWARPNMSVAELKNREYVTIFPQTKATPEDALKVVLEFEKMANHIFRQVAPTAKKLPSQVDVVYDLISPATHLKKVAIFGSASSNSTTHESFTSTNTCSTNSSINSSINSTSTGM